MRPPALKTRSAHSRNSNFQELSDGLKVSFLIFKALKTKKNNFSAVG